jgi:hypothetical protein
VTSNVRGPANAGFVVSTFDESRQAYAAIERLRRAGFFDEDLQFAMRGEHPPRGVGELGKSVDRTVAGNLGAFVGLIVGALLGVVAAMLLDPVDTWALPAGALLGLLGGGFVGQLLFHEAESVWLQAARSDDARNALRQGRAIVAVRGGDRYEEATELLQAAR